MDVCVRAGVLILEATAPALRPGQLTAGVYAFHQFSWGSLPRADCVAAILCGAVVETVEGSAAVGEMIGGSFAAREILDEPSDAVEIVDTPFVFGKISEEHCHCVVDLHGLLDLL